MANILITGANGFIGSHVTKHHGVAWPPDRAHRRRAALARPFAARNKIDQPDHERHRRQCVSRLCEKERPTHVFHAAHPPRDETPTVLNYCYHAMTNILEAAKDLKIQRVVYSSSASIYGQLSKAGRQPRQGRRRGDNLSDLFLPRRKNSFRMDGQFLQGKTWRRFRRLRYSSVYGPGLYRSIPLELKKGILGQPCRPFLTRPLDDLIYIDDIADAVSRALFTEKPLSRAYNIGLDKAYVSEDLQRAIQKALPDLSSKSASIPTPPKSRRTDYAVRWIFRWRRKSSAGHRRFIWKKASRGSLSGCKTTERACAYEVRSCYCYGVLSSNRGP